MYAVLLMKNGKEEFNLIPDDLKGTQVKSKGLPIKLKGVPDGKNW
jgi:hypothetical protein